MQVGKHRKLLHSPALVSTIVALITNANKGARSNVWVTNNTLPITFLAQAPNCNTRLLSAHNKIWMMLSHCVGMKLLQKKKTAEELPAKEYFWNFPFLIFSPVVWSLRGEMFFNLSARANNLLAKRSLRKSEFVPSKIWTSVNSSFPTTSYRGLAINKTQTTLFYKSLQNTSLFRSYTSGPVGK